MGKATFLIYQIRMLLWTLNARALTTWNVDWHCYLDSYNTFQLYYTVYTMYTSLIKPCLCELSTLIFFLAEREHNTNEHI